MGVPSLKRMCHSCPTFNEATRRVRIKISPGIDRFAPLDVCEACYIQLGAPETIEQYADELSNEDVKRRVSERLKAYRRGLELEEGD